MYTYTSTSIVGSLWVFVCSCCMQDTALEEISYFTYICIYCGVVMGLGVLNGGHYVGIF